MRHLKRLLVDSLGNYIVFAPLVIGMTPALHDAHAAVGYLIAAIPISLVGSRILTAFFKHFWYPLWKENF